MKNFELILKNEKEKFYRTISWIIIITNLLVFIYLSAAGNFKKIGPLVFVLLTILALIIPFYFKNKGEKPGLAAAFFVISLGWFNSDTYWWMGLIVFLFLIMDRVSERKLVVKISPEKVIYPSWPEKKINWNELNNLILKDGLLTVDFKNNKIIQQLILNPSQEPDEKEFNEFCQQQLNK
jgi:hypothetical protein